MPKHKLYSVYAIVMSVALVGLIGVVPSDAGRRGSTTVFEDFENPDDLGLVENLIIGVQGAKAVLDGGEIAVRSKGHFYQSFPHAWVFDPGEKVAAE